MLLPAKKKEPYNSELYKKTIHIPVTCEITIDQSILLVRSQGIKIITAT